MIIEEADHHVHELALDLDLDEFVNLDEEARGDILKGFKLWFVDFAWVIM